MTPRPEPGHAPSAAEVAHDLLSVLWGDEVPTIEALAQALDRLLARSHDVPMADCADEDHDPPPVDGAALYRDVAQRFPDLGLYRVTDPLASIDEALMMADAIDDLADITRDLRQVVWHATNLGADDAAWSFRLLFPHWGRHARELALYLHARCWG
ncbi:hypothetical protein U1703_06550 [Sphingomonas sp. PB1R3]